MLQFPRTEAEVLKYLQLGQSEQSLISCSLALFAVEMPVWKTAQCAVVRDL